MFRAAIPTPPATIDVMTNISATTRQVAWMTLETLVTYDGKYNISPQLAEKWQVSADGKTYAFTLRQGVKFHNGKELTSADVVASLKRFLEVTPRKSEFALLDHYEAAGPYTVVLTLKRPSASFLDTLAYPVGYLAIFPQEIIAGKRANQLKAEDMIGTGPYRLVEYLPDQLARYRRFEGYSPPPGDAKGGLAGARNPYFDEVVLAFVPEAGTRLAGLEKGDYDFIDGVDFAEFNRLQARPDITPLVLSPSRWPIVFFNHANEWSKSLKFRQAVQAALDHEAIAQAITAGHKELYRLQPSLWFPESRWHSDAGKELYNRRDLEKARRLLRESGYAGQEIVLVTNRAIDMHYKTIIAVADQLKKELGVNVRVDVLDIPGQRRRWTQKNTWHIAVTGYQSQALFAPQAFGTVFHSSSKSGERGFYANPAMDALFDKAAAATADTDRKQAYGAVQKLFYEDVPGIKIADIHWLVAARKNIKGLELWYNIAQFWNIWRE